MPNQPDLTQKVAKQIEYYFSDVNLSKDKFMQEEIQKDSGFVPLETLIKFNRLKSLTTDFQVIIDSLKNSELIEVNEADKKIRRAKPLPDNLEEFEASLKQNTVYVKGFPADITLDELQEFFAPHGKVLSVFMRRFPASKQFKGSVFVTFNTHDEMQKLLNLAELKHDDKVLNKESQEDYFKRKGPELQKARESKNKKEQEKLEKEKKKIEAEEAYLKQKQVPGAVIHIKGLNKEGTRENIKELFDSHAKVQWIDYNKGEPEAFLRFSEANSAKEAVEKAIKSQGGAALVLKDATLEVRVLEGDEETTYWKDSLHKQAAGRTNKHANRNKKGGHQRGGGRRNNKRKGGYKKDDDDDEDDDGEEGDENEAVNGEKAAKAKNGEVTNKKVKLDGEEVTA